jgi:hypothetical protein
MISLTDQRWKDFEDVHRVKYTEPSAMTQTVLVLDCPQTAY